MHLAYIILAHKNPEQLFRLVSRLNHPDDYFFIHIDKKVDIKPFHVVFENSGFNIKFITRRENGRWGDLGIVKATINSLIELVNSNLQYTHVSLLSGQDYPIKPLSVIRSFFLNNVDKSFVEYIPFPVKHLNYGGLHRIESYSFNIGTRRETYIPFKWKNNFNFKGKLQNIILRVICMFLSKRKMPFGWQAYYGSQWWSLNYEAVNCVMKIIVEKEEYLNYHKYSLLPDEMFFQSILLNNFKGNLINDNLRLIIWNKADSHPATLTENNFNKLNASPKMFARKFDFDTKILNLLDQYYGEKTL